VLGKGGKVWLREAEIGQQCGQAAQLLSWLRHFLLCSDAKAK